MKAFSKVLIWILVVLILAGVAGMLYAFIGNGQRNFYVRYGNETLPARSDNIVFEKNSYTVLSCGTLTGQKVEYTVTVTFDTSKANDMSFYHGDKLADFKRELTGYDCSSLFNIKIYDGYFTFIVPKDLTLTKVIQSKYPDETITGVTEIDLWSKDYFVLTVTDRVEQSSVRISFH